MEKGALEKVLKMLHPGDLICVNWCDASVGKSSHAGEIDIPVQSWGIFVGILGEKIKHVILCQNNFHYSNGLYDVDYTAIPLTWTTKIKVVNGREVTPGEARNLLVSFVQGRNRVLKRRVENHHAGYR